MSENRLAGIGMTSARTRDRLVQRLQEQGISNLAVLDRMLEYSKGVRKVPVIVEGDKVTPLERGQGLDPWDKAKVVFTGVGPAARELAATTPIYIEEAAAAAPVVHVPAIVLSAEQLPKTGSTNGVVVAVLWIAIGAALVVRRRSLFAPARGR